MLTNSSNNTLYQNIARYNYQDGILVNLSSNGNNLTENKVCGNLWNGIAVNGSSWNDLVNNEVCDNGRNGILLTGADHNNLTNNVVYNNTLKRHQPVRI